MRVVVFTGAILLIAVAALVVAPTVSWAGQVDPVWFTRSGAVNVLVTGPNGTPSGTSAGQFVWTVDTSTDPNFDPGSSFPAYCIELEETVSSTAWTSYYFDDIDDNAPFDNGGGSWGFDNGQAMGEDARDALAELFYAHWTTYGLSGNYIHRAAFQIAIWEIVHEGVEGSSTYNTTSGEIIFGGTGDAATARALANTLISTRGTIKEHGIVALVSDGQQDMITRIVPLPPAAFLGLGMLGMLGVARLRRRRQTA